MVYRRICSRMEVPALTPDPSLNFMRFLTEHKAKTVE